MFNWQPEEEKPEPYKEVLLRLTGDHYTTGWWADKANKGEGSWIGLAYNISPPVYTLMPKSVTHWTYIITPDGYRSFWSTSWSGLEE